MTEPITIATVVIGGLVNAYKAYTEYKAAVTQATAKQEAPPIKNAAVAQGEQVVPLIQAGIAQHGDAKEQTTLQLFEDDPETYQQAFEKVLARVAARDQPFAQQLQTLAQQANLQTGGLQGGVEVKDQGKVYGTAAGINTGTIQGGTYTFRADVDTRETC